MNRSLHLRLLLFAGATSALALIAGWIVLGVLFDRHLSRQLQAELQRHGLSIIAGLELDPQGRPVLARAPADPRFSRPASGLYWRVSTPAGELRSRSLWDGALPPVAPDAAGGWVEGGGAGPFEPGVAIAARSVQPGPDGRRALVEVAADRRPLADARAAFDRETGIFLAALWAALALAAWAQVRLGLTPLRRVVHELGAMQRSVDARLAEGEHPREIRPLTVAINRFADRRAEDIDRARQRSRDLAHALKTPITALALQIDKLEGDRARDMRRSLSLLSSAAESELARVEASSQVSGDQRCAIAAAADRVIAVVALTPDGSRLAFDNAIPRDLLAPMREEAALETLGALLENAARHARSVIMLDGARDGDECWITIADDGTGIPEDQRADALSRGMRLDQRGARHGLGLSIAQDFVASSQGELTLEDADDGGLRIRLAWRQR